MTKMLIAICRYLIRIMRLLNELKSLIENQSDVNAKVLQLLTGESGYHLQYIRQRQSETVYRDAKYAMEFIGISESTLARHQRKGQLAVAKIDRGKRYFRQQDLERFKREYWNLPD